METIADAFENNARIRERLRSVLAEIPTEKLAMRAEGEEWSIQDIVEHIAIVDQGACKICTKLVNEAKAGGKSGSGKLDLSSEFSEQTAASAEQKLQAPERVRPTGEHSVEQSLAKLDETEQAFAAIRPDLESYDLSEAKFPHPYFGPMTAAEWLVVAGGHERRHVEQIERLISKL
jgi:uncharacterized damage-inducible protein DinB